MVTGEESPEQVRAGWMMEVRAGRVFLRLGNYEFEVAVPESTIGASREFMALTTMRLIAEQMTQVTA